jgi:hypothetical protein
MFLLTSRAVADDRVVLLEAPAGAQHGLESALRIQLIGAADVETRPKPALSGLPERIAAASDLVRDERALLVVWTDGPVQLADGSQEAVLYAVGQREGRAQLEVVRVPGGTGPDMDRTLALKVRAIIDELRSQHSGLAPSMQAPEQGEYLPTAEPTEPRIEPEPAAYAWSVRLAAGASAAPLARSNFGQWGVAASAGPALLGRRVRFAGMLELGWYPSLDVTRSGAAVQVREIAPAIAFEAALRTGSVWLGARTGPALGFVSATGETAAGARGSADADVMSWLFGVNVELPIGAGFGASLGLDAQAQLRRQRFAVNGAQVADLGRVRPFARLLLVWTPSPSE